MSGDKKMTIGTKNVRILALDDNHVNLEIVLEMMRRQGFQVEGVDNGRQFLARVRDFNPHLVLMDLSMPGMDGFEVLASFRRNGGAATPVIAVTGNTLPEDRARAMQAGFDAFVAKPFTMDELMNAIDTQLESKAAD